MSRLTIVEGNSNDKDNVRVLITKGEKGADGVSPIVKTQKQDGVAEINIEDAEGVKTAYVKDGFSPVVETSKTGKVATVEIEDAEGTHTFTLNDGEDGETYEVPTNAVVGWDSENAIPNGYEEIDNPNNYSSNETKIGTWIDGKPLYRKVFETTLPSQKSNIIETGFGNTIIVRKLYGIFCDIANKPFSKPIPYFDIYNSNHITVFIGSGNGNIYVSALGDNNNEQTFIYVEYTKTTD